MSLPRVPLSTDSGEKYYSNLSGRNKNILACNILKIDEIFICFHVFSISEDFKERRNNTDLALKVEIIFLSFSQPYYVMLRRR